VPLNASSASKRAAGVVETLCGSCGFCCDGTLFGDVRLRPSEDREKLLARGVPIDQRGRSFRLAQPCTCFQSGRCTIYLDRPQRCRTFECGILKRALSQKISMRAALAVIGRARRARTRVEELLGEQASESLPLRSRVADVMRQPLDLSDSNAARRMTRLMKAMQRLTELVEAEFLRA
jgi:Fe-S-cluster containining protein